MKSTPGTEALPTTTLVPWQVGFAVGDIDQAVGMFSTLGIGPWGVSAWRQSRWYDPATDGIVEPVSRVALGRLSETMSVELIQADAGAGPVPAPWRVGEVGGPAHIAFWCADVEASALELIEGGVSLALAKLTGDLVLRSHQIGSRTVSLPSELDTSYYAPAEGPMVELVPDRVWSERLPALLGRALDEIVTAPPRRL